MQPISLLFIRIGFIILNLLAGCSFIFCFPPATLRKQLFCLFYLLFALLGYVRVYNDTIVFFSMRIS